MSSLVPLVLLLLFGRAGSQPDEETAAPFVGTFAPTVDLVRPPNVSPVVAPTVSTGDGIFGSDTSSLSRPVTTPAPTFDLPPSLRTDAPTFEPPTRQPLARPPVITGPGSNPSPTAPRDDPFAPSTNDSTLQRPGQTRPPTIYEFGVEVTMEPVPTATPSRRIMEVSTTTTTTETPTLSGTSTQEPTNLDFSEEEEEGQSIMATTKTSATSTDSPTIAESGTTIEIIFEDDIEDIKTASPSDDKFVN